MKTHVCHIDRKKCDATASYSGADAVAEWRLQELLPCDRCRQAELHANAIKGLSFGKHERRVLLEAPSSEAKYSIVPPIGTSRSDNESTRRAIRRLAEVGLLSISEERVKKQIGPTQWDTRTYHVRTVRRSPLGQAVVDKVGTDLTSGKVIRWSQHQSALLSEVRLHGDELIAVFDRRVRGHVDERETILGELRSLSGNVE